MKIIDKFILKQYFFTFFYCILLLMAIIVVVDISEKTDDFVKTGFPVSKIITDYYFGFIPRMAAMLFPLFIFISVIFFTSKMAGRSEIIAILSSGVSFRRFTRPYMIGGLILTAMLWVGYQSVIPKANLKWSVFEKNHIDINQASGRLGSTYKQHIYFKLDKNSFLGVRGYDTVNKAGNNMFIQRFDDNKLVYNMRANNFSWDDSLNKWKVRNIQERYLDSMSERVVLTKERMMGLKFSPLDLNKDDYLKDQMTTRDLNDFIRLEKMRGSEIINTLLVEKYNRSAIPASVFILTVIGVSLSSRKVRGGSGAHLALGLLLSVTYILFTRFSVVFATKGSFSPFLAAWTPNIIFGILAVYLFIRASR